MEKIMICREILGRTEFKSYSELYFMLALGRVFGDRGYVFDMKDMIIKGDLLPKDDDIYKYLLQLVGKGYIDIGSNISGDIDSRLDIDTKPFEGVKMFSDEEEELLWSYTNSKATYSEKVPYLLKIETLDSTIMHIVAYHIMNVLLGNENRKLVLDFDRPMTKSSFVYINVYSCLQTIGWLSDYVEVRLDLGNAKVDLDYSIFCNNGYKAGRYKFFSADDKLKLLKKFGIVEGSIVIFWTRSGMCPNSIFGKIDSAIVAKVEKIDVERKKIVFTTISLNKTKEEQVVEYYSISPEIRDAYSDLLDKKPVQSRVEKDLIDIGVDNYLYKEEYFVTRVNDEEEVTKLISSKDSDEYIQVVMSGADAIYWLLRQYDIDFNEKLYKEMYGGSKEFLYDVYYRK